MSESKMTLGQLKEELALLTLLALSESDLSPDLTCRRSDAYVEFVKGIIILAIEFELLSPEDRGQLPKWWKETIEEWVETHSFYENLVFYPW